MCQLALLGLACLKPSEMASFIVLPSAVTSATRYGAYFLKVTAGARSYSALRPAKFMVSRMSSRVDFEQSTGIGLAGLLTHLVLDPRVFKTTYFGFSKVATVLLHSIKQIHES